VTEYYSMITSSFITRINLKAFHTNPSRSPRGNNESLAKRVSQDFYQRSWRSWRSWYGNSTNLVVRYLDCYSSSRLKSQAGEIRIQPNVITARVIDGTTTRRVISPWLLGNLKPPSSIRLRGWIATMGLPSVMKGSSCEIESNPLSWW
jgi:hypothetical protein